LGGAQPRLAAEQVVHGDHGLSVDVRGEQHAAQRVGVATDCPAEPQRLAFLPGGDCVSDDELSLLWRQQWPTCPPLAHTLKYAYRDRWVRFYSLPYSKRYPDSDAEYGIALHRYNTILNELFRGQDVRVITTNWSCEPEPPGLAGRHPCWQAGAHHWISVRTDEDETDPDFITYTHLYVSRMLWRPGSLDDLLRAVADDVTSGVLISSLSFDRVHHPYDGGADVLLPTTSECDAIKRRHTGWLSDHPLGD